MQYSNTLNNKNKKTLNKHMTMDSKSKLSTFRACFNMWGQFLAW